MTARASGALFQNKDKKQDNHPDYRGDFKLTQELLDEIAVAFGTGHDKVQIAGWKKKDRNGNPYLSLTISPPYRKDKGADGDFAPPPARPATRTRAELDDDIPF
jgi:uncharacterized protein (DUF736 family)